MNPKYNKTEKMGVGAQNSKMGGPLHGLHRFFMKVVP